MTLIEFLLARIADDEKIGALLQRSSLGEDRRVAVLVECEAKRALVALHHSQYDECPAYTHHHECVVCSEDGYEEAYGDAYRLGDPWPCKTLRILATVYADHSDYDETWRP